MQAINPIFKNKNVINNLDLTTPIYKFFPLKYIPALLQGQLYVSKVASWEDVYENFLFKQNFALADGTRITAENLIKYNYVQSKMKQMLCGEYIQALTSEKTKKRKRLPLSIFKLAAIL